MPSVGWKVQSETAALVHCVSAYAVELWQRVDTKVEVVPSQRPSKLPG